MGLYGVLVEVSREAGLPVYPYYRVVGPPHVDLPREPGVLAKMFPDFIFFSNYP